MITVNCVVLNFEMTDKGGGIYRTDERVLVDEKDIRVIEGAAPVTLTSAEVYSKKRIATELPDGTDANALRIVNYDRTTNTYQALPSWLTERVETEKKG